MWAKTKVSFLHTAILDLPYKFITAAPLEQIPNKLITRQIGNVVQAEVYLESGVEGFVTEGGKSFVKRNSELGHVLIPHDRMPHGCETKRFRTWVTFMRAGVGCMPTWIFTRRERLIEVDKDGNELLHQFDEPFRLPDDSDNDVEVSGGSSDTADSTTKEDTIGFTEEFHDCLP